MKRCVYVAPHASTAKERFNEWSFKFGKTMGYKAPFLGEGGSYCGACGTVRNGDFDPYLEVASTRPEDVGPSKYLQRVFSRSSTRQKGLMEAFSLMLQKLCLLVLPSCQAADSDCAAEGF